MTPGTTILLTTGETVTVAQVIPSRRLVLDTLGRYTPLRCVVGYVPPRPAAERLAGADLARPVRELTREYGVSWKSVRRARDAAGIARGFPLGGTVEALNGSRVPRSMVREEWRRREGRANPARATALALGLTVEQVRECVRA